MATNFPTTLDDSTTIPVESAATKLSVNHVTAHQNIQDALEAVEAKIGVDGSAVTTSHDYKLSGVTGSDKSVSKTGTETLTNKTLTAPVITSPTLNLGSDAEGDTYYRNSSGALVRLARGTDNYIYKMNGNVPNWEAEATIGAATDTTAGIGILATAAQITSGTASESGYPLVITPDQLLSAGIKQTDIQTFTADGTWTKPTGANVVEVICIGAGGGGGSSSGAVVDAGASGGGGGAKTIKKFNASDLASTVAITRGTGGTGGTNGNPGTAGGTSSFGTLLYAAGGGGGTNVGSNNSSSGGGGGGNSEGQGGQSGAGSLGGFPNNVTVALVGVGAGGGGGVNNAAGKAAEYGGGSGGGASGTGSVNGYAGGNSIYGAGGGGGGGSKGTTTGGAGGGVLTLSSVGGAGGASGVAGTAGSAASDAFGCGTGGGGGGGNSVGAGGAGGAGGLPGGGGGGGGTGSSSNSGTGGNGANGKVVVITYF